MAYPCKVADGIFYTSHDAPRLGPFRCPANGRLFGVFGTVYPDRAHVYWSGDDGQTWAEADPEFNGLPFVYSTPFYGTYSCCDNGVYIWVVFCDPFDSNNLRVTYFDMTSGLWGTTLPGGFAVTLGAERNLVFRVLIQNTHVVMIWDTAGGIAYSVYDQWGGGWGPQTAVVAVGELLDAVLGGSDRIHVVYWDSVGENLCHRSISSAGALGAAQNIESGVDVTRYRPTHASFSAGLVVPYIRADGSLGVLRGTSAADPVWTDEPVTATVQEGDLTAGAVHVGSALSVAWGKSLVIYRNLYSGVWGADALAVDNYAIYPFATGGDKFRMFYGSGVEGPSSMWYWEPGVGAGSRYHGR